MTNKGLNYWMPIGAALGVLLGSLMDSPGLGVAFGAGVGLVIGAAHKNDSEDSPKE